MDSIMLDDVSVYVDVFVFRYTYDWLCIFYVNVCAFMQNVMQFNEIELTHVMSCHVSVDWGWAMANMYAIYIYPDNPDSGCVFGLNGVLFICWIRDHN